LVIYLLKFQNYIW